MEDSRTILYNDPMAGEDHLERFRLKPTDTSTDHGIAFTKSERTMRNVIVLPTIDGGFPIDERDYKAVIEILLALESTNNGTAGISLAKPEDIGENDGNRAGAMRLRKLVGIRDDDTKRRVHKFRLNKHLIDWTCVSRIGSLPSCIRHLDHLQDLDLNTTSLISSIPEEIGELNSLERLNLSSTSITSLPPSIGKLTNLQELDLSVTNLESGTSLPEEIGDLVRLEKLNLSSILLSSLPPSIGRLCSLKVLDLSYTNTLSSLPQEIGDLSNLQTLALFGSMIGTLPPSIGKLQKLEYLDLGCTYMLSSLPETIADLVLLKTLNLDRSSVVRVSNHPTILHQCKILWMLTKRSRLLGSLGTDMDCRVKKIARRNTAFHAKKLCCVLAYNRTVPFMKKTPAKWPHLLSSASHAFSGDCSFIYQLLVDGREALVGHLLGLKSYNKTQK